MFFSESFSEKTSENNSQRGVFFPIFMLYCEGRHFSSRTLEIGKVDKILDPEINFKILY